jgi:hypothetical protein
MIHHAALYVQITADGTFVARPLSREENVRFGVRHQ